MEEHKNPITALCLKVSQTIDVDVFRFYKDFICLKVE